MGLQIKYSRKGKLNEKNSCTPINPKNYSYKEFDNEKNSCSSKIPLHPAPTITFLMARP